MRTLLIDADIVCFLSAAACDKRSIKITHTPSGQELVMKTRTDFKKRMKEKGKPITEDYLIEDVVEPDKLENCLNTVKVKIKNLVELAEADTHEIYLSGQFNFRDELPLPFRYKGERVDKPKPTHLYEARNYLLKHHGARSIDFHEVDDEVTIRGYEELEKGNEAVIATNDKDAYQSTGLGILNLNALGDGITTIPELGGLVLHPTKGVKGSGVKFLSHQLLYGDDVDCYKPYQLVGKGVFGEKSSYDLLDPLKSPQECLEAVIKQYKEWYPKPFQYVAWNGQVIQADWLFMLKLYWQCAYMKRTRDGSDTIEKFFGNYGVEIE